MGMFDNISFEPAKDYTIVCSHGHPLKDLQTKSLYNAMESYLVFERNLYKVDSKTEEFFEKNHDVIWKGWKKELEPIKSTMTINFYGDCDVCIPIFYIHNESEQKDVRVYKTWCEFSAEFFRGNLMSLKVVEMETKEQAIARMSEYSEIVDPEDQRVKGRWDLIHHFFKDTK